MAAPESYFLNTVFDWRYFLKKSLLGSLLFGSAGLVANCRRQGGGSPAPFDEGRVQPYDVYDFSARALAEFDRIKLHRRQ